MKNLRQCFGVALWCFSLFSALPAHAQETEQTYIEKWVSTESEIRTDPAARDRLFQAFLQPASTEEISAALTFLMDRISAGVTDFGYHQAYSKLSWSIGTANNKTRTKNSAAITAAAALLILETDMAHCKKASGKRIYIDTITDLKEPLYYLQILDGPTRVKMLNEAMKFEEKISGRPGNPLVCEKNAKGVAEFLKKDDWQQERKDIRAGFQKSLMPKE